LKKNLKISINYISNFKLLNIFTKKKYNRANCKKFILFIFFFNFLNIKYKWFSKVKLFIKPRYSNTYTLLRAPYRFKLSRDQVTFSRYHIVCSMLFKHALNYFKFLKTKDIFIFFNLLRNLIPAFESNVCYQKKIKIYFNFFFKTNFLFLNYKLN